jgi:predicted Zn-dependent protease
MSRVLILLLVISGVTAFAEPAVSARIPDNGPAAEAFRHEAAARYRKILAGLSARHKLDDDEALLGRVRKVARSLITVAAAARPETAAWSWEMHVTSDVAIDAFCMAGGKVLVGSEFVRRLGLGDGELAMLLGHEMAHALAGHRREVVRGGMESDPAEEIRGNEIALLQEDEADRIGMSLAYRAGWPLSSLVSFYDKLAQAQAPGTFSTSHPSAASRAVTARALAQELGP